ncbi:hypothetical protein N9N08_00275 [bacterium]|jgi:CO dehydrogenase/acetyl-CoA synthase alpha subunit|nr:hypothetical protein [bacterium]
MKQEMTDDDVFDIIDKLENVIEEFEMEGLQDLSTVSVMLAVAIKRIRKYVPEEELEEMLSQLLLEKSGTDYIKEIKKEIIH